MMKSALDDFDRLMALAAERDCRRGTARGGPAWASMETMKAFLESSGEFAVTALWTGADGRRPATGTGAVRLHAEQTMLRKRQGPGARLGGGFSLRGGAAVLEGWETGSESFWDGFMLLPWVSPGGWPGVLAVAGAGEEHRSADVRIAGARSGTEVFRAANLSVSGMPTYASETVSRGEPEDEAGFEGIVLAAATGQGAGRSAARRV